MFLRRPRRLKVRQAIAEWVGLGAGLWLAHREVIKRGGWRASVFMRATVLKTQALKKLGVTNSNIFIRTLMLAIGFSFFGNAAASEGEVFLAGNHIHMQFITMIALVLDAFAHTAEAVTGSAFGAGHKARFKRAVRLTTEFSIIFACLAGLTILVLGPYVIGFLTKDPAVIDSATRYLPYCALAPVLGFSAYQLDGIFIGTTQTRPMRDAGIMALLIYLAAHFMLQPRLGPEGLWAAFLIYYVARAVTLGLFYPGVVRQIKTLKE